MSDNNYIRTNFEQWFKENYPEFKLTSVIAKVAWSAWCAGGSNAVTGICV